MIEQQGWEVAEDTKGSSERARKKPPLQLPEAEAARAEWESLPAGKPFLNLDAEDVEEFWLSVQRDFVRRQDQGVLGKRKREEEG